MNASSIMRFEELLKLWRDGRTGQSILEFLGIGSQGDIRGAEESDPGFLRILCERLDGTWWEVTWTPLPIRRRGTGRVQCRYLADSLKDAVRRCPGALLPSEAAIDDADDGVADDDLEFPETMRGRRRSTVTRAHK